MKGHTNNPNGRPKGTPNKRTQQLAELAKAHDADPALFLIHVMKGNAKAFEQEEDEYDDEGELIGTKMAAPSIKFETRMEAAKELMPYLYGKRKPIDSEGNDSSTVLEDILSAIDGTK
jgi:hypothetical protein